MRTVIWRSFTRLTGVRETNRPDTDHCNRRCRYSSRWGFTAPRPASDSVERRTASVYLTLNPSPPSGEGLCRHPVPPLQNGSHSDTYWEGEGLGQTDKGSKRPSDGGGVVKQG